MVCDRRCRYCDRRGIPALLSDSNSKVVTVADRVIDATEMVAKKYRIL